MIITALSLGEFHNFKLIKEKNEEECLAEAKTDEDVLVTTTPSTT